MSKLTFDKYYSLGNEEIKSTFSEKQIIEFLDEFLHMQVSLVQKVADDLGISIWETGSINPKFYNTHRRLGTEPGMRLFILD